MASDDFPECIIPAQQLNRQAAIDLNLVYPRRERIRLLPGPWVGEVVRQTVPFYDSWLRVEGVGNTIESKCIYHGIFMMEERINSYDPDYDIHVEARTAYRSMDSSLKEGMLNWRTMPDQNDALQTAVKYRGRAFVRELLRLQLFDVNNYRGFSGLVNHPAHMALCVGDISILKELLPLLQCIPPEDWTARVTVEDGNVVQCSSQNYLQRPKSLLLHVYRHYFHLLERLDPSQVTKSAIEFVWNVLKDVCSNMTWRVHEELLVGLGSDFTAAIPFYQLINVVSWRDDPITSAYGILELGHIVPENQTSYLLNWMRNDQLQHLRKAILNHLGAGQVPRYPRTRMKRSKSSMIMGMMEEEKQTRSLQQHCMFTVLRCVGGLSVRVVELPIPGRMKNLFQIPFREKYEKLCEASNDD